AAIFHAKAGRPVFPCGPDKRPLVRWREAATCDPDQLARWWNDWPNAMPGLPTGRASGLAVLDLDVKEGKDGIAGLRDMGLDPDAMSPCIVTTMSGGLHLYFRWHEGLACSAGKIAPGVDVRGEGGYVIAPGATGEAGSYSTGDPVPDDLSEWPEELRPAERVADDLAALLGDDDDLLPDAFEAMRERDWQPDRIHSALRAIKDASDRDTWLQIGMALHHASGGSTEGYDLWCRWSRRCPEKYNDRDQRRTWKSFGRRAGGVKIGTLYQIAKGYGWSDDRRPADLVDDDLAALLGVSKAAEDWQAQLDRDDKGIQAAIANVRIILGNDPRVRGCLSFDLFQSCRVLRRKPDLAGDFWRLGPLSDVQEDALKEWLARPKSKGGWGLRVSTENLQAGINLAAHSARFHPIREWLDAQHHDGKPRADRLFVDYLGTPDTAYHREAARLWLVGAVARVHEPGHKFDFVPILEGKQGVRKSTFAKVVGVDWGGDPVIAKWGDGPKVMEQISPFWIVELGELAGMRKAEVAELKAALSRTTDHGRMAYDRNAHTRPRQCVFIGTTNESHYLRDHTGNRRYWPIAVLVPSINTDKLQRERGQIWAEALALYRAMRVAQPHGDLPLFLSPEAEAEARELQASRKQDTPAEMLAARIVEWVQTPLGAANEADDLDQAAPQRLRELFCAQSVWHEMLGKPEGITMSHAEAIMYGNACNMAAAELGWAEGRERTQAYGRVRVYRRIGK
ncbi:MAG: bifunctional DNA primase/polymerase, partial [Roseovarius sp.]|nr:bifunctional DNA primase/polymerase [Roseovarius sp.]